MKKIYSKPHVEIEVYQLNASIAVSCGNKVTFGPEAPGKVTCDEFKDAFATTFGLRNNPFYADGSAHCDCYYTSGGGGYFTS